MDISAQTKTRHLYEYCFYDNIRKYNDINKDNLDIIIKKSEAYKLHDNILKLIKKAGYSLGGCPMSVYTKATNDVLRDRVGYDVYKPGNMDLTFKKQLNDYKSMTGFRPDVKELPEGNILPISPYDRRYRNFAMPIKNGSSLGGIVSGGVESDKDLNSYSGLRKIQYRSNVYIDRNGNLKSSGDNSDTLFSAEDVIGLSRIKKYMTQKEYDNVKSWVYAGFDTENLDSDVLNARFANLEKSKAILDTLQKLGRTYKIKADVNVGQITASVDGTSLSVRLLDTDEHSQYIGRVYDDGVYYSFNTTRYSGNGQTVSYDPTIEDVTVPLRLALGEPVKSPESDKNIGEASIYKRTAGGKLKSYVTSYHSRDGSFNAVYKDFSMDGKPDYYGNKVKIIANAKNRYDVRKKLYNEQVAEEILREAVTTARDNFENSIDVDSVIAYYQSDQEEDFIYHSNPEIASIQRTYLDYLNDESRTLLKPGVSIEDYHDFIDDNIANGMNDTIFEDDRRNYLFDLNSNDRTETVRNHLRENLLYQIGTFDNNNGKRFDPVMVAKYQNSSDGVAHNNKVIIEGLKLLNIDADELRGDGFYNETVRYNLVKFDSKSATPLVEKESEFMQNVFKEVKGSLRNNGLGIRDNDILIDDKGIIQYTGRMSIYESYDPNDLDAKVPYVTGYIGQIFEPEKDGVVYTKFASNNNYAFVPGYIATVIPDSGENKPLEERTKLKGYEQILLENIRYNIRNDLMMSYNNKRTMGSNTSLNSTYRMLYSERHTVNFKEQFAEQGLDKDLLDAMIATEASRVRYSNDIKDGSTIHAAYMANKYNFDFADDIRNDAFVTTGGRNVAILTKESDGYFDPIVTNSTSTIQGTVRYLVEGCKVDKDGFMIKSTDKDDRCPIMKHPVARHMDKDPFDRVCMSVSNLMKASTVTKPVNVAQMTFGGWNFDDPVVVSKEFAETNKIRTHNGTLRNLMIGDKISDLHGNKGVISLVVDREMSKEQAKIDNIEKEVEMFKLNPNLDIVMAPFPAVSRFNGGTTRELMEKTSDLVDLDGNVHSDSIGQMRIIVTDKSVDDKTNVYDTEATREGKGRKISSQLAWIMTAKDCPALMREAYGSNNSSMSNLREMLIATGLDISETGELRDHYEPHAGEERYVIKSPDLVYKELKNGRKLDTRTMRGDFEKLIQDRGGIMEIPFELNFLSKEKTPPMNDNKTDVIYEKQEWERRGYYRKDGTWVRPTTVHRHKDKSEMSIGNDTFGLPLLSAHLRNYQDFADGTSSMHEYTQHYVAIFDASIKYRDLQSQLKNDGANIDLLNANMKKLQATAQSRFDMIQKDINERAFQGKHNVFKENIMSYRMPNTATAVWSADPRLDLDQIAISREIAETLGVTDNDYVLWWRDPVLRDGAMRYMRAKVDDNLTGVAIQPQADKSPDGDFDGDSVGLWAPKDEKAKKEAMQKFSMHTNLLDYGSKDENGLYNLYINTGLDIKVGTYANKEYKKEYDRIKVELNKIEGECTGVKLDRMQRKLMTELSNVNRNVLNDTFGKAIISYGDLESHMNSVYNACITTGAKGSPAKIGDYMHYLGAKAKNYLDGDFSNIVDNKSTFATREDNQGTMYATAVKSFGTGIGGSYSQRVFSALRDKCPKAVLELTYPVTQSLLQAKHDPKEAYQKYELLMGPVRDLWKGYKISYKNSQWVTEVDSDNKQISAKPDEWKKMFKEMYESTYGLNVSFNPDYLDEVAHYLTDEDGFITNLESDGFIQKSTLDSLAYGGGYDEIKHLAESHANLFNTDSTMYFRPYSIYKNVLIQSHMDNGSDRALQQYGKKDVLSDNKNKIPKSITVQLPRKMVNEGVIVDMSSGHGDLGE